MNKRLKNIPLSNILFFDIESVRMTKDIEETSKEFEIFRKKLRDKVTGDLPTIAETKMQYNKTAALKMGHIKIVAITVGALRKDGKIYLKTITGEEDEIIKAFCSDKLLNNPNFTHLCGMNIIGYDLPVIYNNGMKYMDMTEMFPDRFIPNDKKPWEMTSIIDLMNEFKGTHYNNNSLDEICFHFGVPSPKSDLDGSMVSDEYWNNGLVRIVPYCENDVEATINVFQKMCSREMLERYVDPNANAAPAVAPPIQPIVQPVQQAASKPTAKKLKSEPVPKTEVAEQKVEAPVMVTPTVSVPATNIPEPAPKVTEAPIPTEPTAVLTSLDIQPGLIQKMVNQGTITDEDLDRLKTNILPLDVIKRSHVLRQLTLLFPNLVVGNALKVGERMVADEIISYRVK